ncbi:unnamed protein product, partial [Allacma fusca]
VVHATIANTTEKIGSTEFWFPSKEECLSKFGEKNLPYFKFCARILKGSPLSISDRGAGIYTREKSPTSGSFQFHLKGIAIDPEFPVLEPNITRGYQLFINTDYLTEYIVQVLGKN